MFNKKVLFRIWPIIKKSRFLRIVFGVNVVLMIFLLASTFFIRSYHQKIYANQTEITKNQQALLKLQKVGKFSDESPSNEVSEKSLANFDEVVPFIAFLENVFYEVDKEAKVSIKTREDQIFKSHFADYEVSTKVRDSKALLNALDQLQSSNFVIHLLDFRLIYEPSESEKLDSYKMNQYDLNIRLFLK